MQTKDTATRSYEALVAANSKKQRGVGKFFDGRGENFKVFIYPTKLKYNEKKLRKNKNYYNH